ncbi:MAG: DinB family protein [Candidatus Eisenbacteria bacterium]|nr:DinB family protein [Candidatus Eisenbacteria bacterium]
MSPEISTPHPGELSLGVLVEYSEYMRERFSMALLEMPHADFVAPLGLSWKFKDIRDLFAHLVDTEDQWIRCVLEGDDQDPPGRKAYPDAAATVRRWEDVRRHTREHLEQLDAAGLEREIVAPFHMKPRFRVKQVFMHLLIHEAHHRGQITAAMRMRGIAPPPSDLYDYLAEQLQ